MWRQYLQRFFSKPEVRLISNYPRAKDIPVLVACSVDEHDNSHTINEVAQFYDIERDNCIVLKQDESIGGDGIIMEGRAVDMYSTFSKERLNSIRVIYNRYCIVRDDFNDGVVITKTLSISSNGNVYVGCMQSYQNVDKQPMFDVTDCNGDFLRRIDEWCWENPISQFANQCMEKHLALSWQKEHGIPVSANLEHAFDAAAERIMFLEKMMRVHHQEFPYLKHWELNMLVSILACLCSENPIEQSMFLKLSGLFDDDTIETLDQTAMINVCKDLKSKNDARKSMIRV